MNEGHEKYIAEGRAWASRLCWDTERHSAWEIVVRMGTRSVYDWVSRRNQLQPDDMMLTLSVPSFAPWFARLTRHDTLFSIAWRHGATHIDAEQLRFRRLTPWPNLVELDAFPALVSALNDLALRPIIADAQVLILSPSETTKTAIRSWLSGVCDNVEFIGDEVDRGLCAKG